MTIEDTLRLEHTADLFKAVGHPMRLAMLERLKEQPWCVCDLAEHLGLNKSIASKHLSLLHDAGLLEMEKRGTQVIYTLVAPCIVEMARCTHKTVTERKIARLQASVG